MTRIYPDELAHFGIKGMKWGVRRFQNPDGTRTEAGKRRERKDSSPRSFTKAYALKHPVRVLASKKSTAADKKTAAIGLAASTALAVGAAYATPKLISKGSERVYKVMNKFSKASSKVADTGPEIVDKFGNIVTDPEILRKLGAL